MKRFLALSFLLLSLLTSVAFAQQLSVTPENPSGLYRIKAPVRWRVELTGMDADTPVEARYEVCKDGAAKPIKTGNISVKAGHGLVEISLDEPCALMVNVSAKIGNKRLEKQAGTAVAPEQIRPSLPRPDDFDAFWKAKIESLKAIPMNAQVERVDKEKNVDYFKVRMDNIRGTHIYGQLAKPKRPGKLPAMLVVQWAGVYGLNPWFAVGPANEGWLTLNIMPHDLPFDKPQAFYDEASKTTLRDYPRIGSDNRETSYFLRMMLGCYRAADYLAQRPDWDGKTLLVFGVSQGGYQSLVTAALHPQITAMIAIAPGGCDITAPLAGRGDSFPSLLSGWPRPANQDAVVQAGRYYDVVNFASRIKCPALVSVGLIDTVCRPTGIYAAFNQIPGTKEMLVQPDAIHDGAGLPRCQARMKAWRQALLKGQPLPPPRD
jgi:cephalosporin-C deacetylase-like acetyl esterase